MDTGFFQENDAIAKVDIVAGTIDSLQPLPRKDWNGIEIDASDRDGGNGKPGKVQTDLQLSKKIPFWFLNYPGSQKLKE